MSYADKARSTGAILDEYDWRTLHIIDEHGWMVQMVAGDDANPPFVYTIGAALHRPDLIPWELTVVGMTLEDGKGLLNTIVSGSIQRGTRLREGLIEGLFVGRHVGYIGEIPFERVVPAWFGYGMWFTQTFAIPPLRVAQVVWPDGSSGRLPWDDVASGAAASWPDQPLLCEAPNA